MPLTKIDDRGLTTPVDLLDNEKIRFGTGNDLQIYHDGSHSRIDDTGTGSLVLRSSNFLVEKYGGDYMIHGVADGSVELYHDGSKTAFTSLDAWNIYGRSANSGMLEIASNQGTNNNDRFRIHKTSASSTLSIQNYTSGSWENNLKAIGNGAVELYYDNSKKLETTSYGVLSTEAVKINGNFIELNNSADSQYALNRGTTQLFSIRNNALAGVHINTQNSALLCLGVSTGTNNGSVESTLSINSSGNVGIDNQLASEKLHLADNKKLALGDSADLKIYHDGSNSYINNDTQYLQIQSSYGVLLQRHDGSENLLRALSNGAVELYYDGSKKFETLSSGAKIYGDLRINDEEHIYFGDGADLEIRVGSNNDGVINQANGDLKFQRAGNGKFSIKSTGTHFSDDAFWADSQKAIFGTGSDLQIYHNGSHSYIEESGTGNLYIRSSNTRMQSSTGEDQVLMTEDGAVELYYDNSKKFETISEGIETAEKVRMKYASTVSNVRQTFYQAISNGASHTFQINNGHGGGTVTVVGIRNGNSTFATTRVFPFALRSTANAGVGSSILSVGGAQGGFSYQVAGANRGITVTNNDNTTGNFYVTFDVTGSIS